METACPAPRSVFQKTKDPFQRSALTTIWPQSLNIVGTDRDQLPFIGATNASRTKDERALHAYCVRTCSRAWPQSAGFAVYMAQGYIAQTQADRDRLLEEQAAAPKLVDVVVASKAMKYGDRFTRADLEIIKWQADKVPEGAFNSIVAAQPAETERASYPRTPFSLKARPGHVRFCARLNRSGTPAGQENHRAGRRCRDHGQHQPRTRALAIKVDVSSGVRFLRPGDRVDVYWTGTANGREVTKLIQPTIRLIAIDQSADADRTEETQIARTVTVEATSEQDGTGAGAGIRAADARSGGRRRHDRSRRRLEIDRNTLLGISEEAAPVEEVAEKVCTIRTNKGGEVIETQIPARTDPRPTTSSGGLSSPSTTDSDCCELPT